MIDKRLIQLTEWLNIALKEELAQHAGEKIEITVASADASFRRYFRARIAKKTWVVMDAPPDKEDCKPFVEISTAFHQMKVNVPEIYAQDLSNGFLVLTDFGSTCYLDKLKDKNADALSSDALYSDAMHVLINLQVNNKPKNITLPAYNDELLIREMMLFPDWFLSQHIKQEPNEATMDMLNRTFNWLSQSALEQPTVWVHRDYHSRNLMVLEKNNPGVIDFQDAVEGPITYDLVSLLRDCYIAWPDEKVEAWAKNYLAKLQVASTASQKNENYRDITEKQFLKWFDWMGIQRHLKAIGIFSRLNYRDGKTEYLYDIPRTLNYVVNVSARYPELAEFNVFVSQIQNTLNTMSEKK